VAVFAAGTGNPFFTTDTAAALRCAEIGGQVLMKATKVDGVYDRDPVKDKAAVKFGAVSYDEALRRNLRVMDLTALSLCMENAIPIVVFKMTEKGNFRRCVEGLSVGSIIRKEA
jgi:uridylate kinase